MKKSNLKVVSKNTGPSFKIEKEIPITSARAWAAKSLSRCIFFDEAW